MRGPTVAGFAAPPAPERRERRAGGTHPRRTRRPGWPYRCGDGRSARRPRPPRAGVRAGRWWARTGGGTEGWATGPRAGSWRWRRARRPAREGCVRRARRACRRRRRGRGTRRSTAHGRRRARRRRRRRSSRGDAPAHAGRRRSRGSGAVARDRARPRGTAPSATSCRDRPAPTGRRRAGWCAARRGRRTAAPGRRRRPAGTDPRPSHLLYIGRVLYICRVGSWPAAPTVAP